MTTGFSLHPHTTHGPEDEPARPGQATAAVTRAAIAAIGALRPDDPQAAGDLAKLLPVLAALVRRAELDDALGARRRTAALPALVTDDPAGARARAVIRAVRAAELPEMPAEFPIELPEPGPGGGLDVAAVGGYLRARGDSGDIAEVRVLTGGFSKETVLVGRPDGDEFVLRKVAAGRTADTLAGEYAALEFAASHGIPAPRPRWLDTGGNPLGGPLFATDRMPGTTVGTVNGPAEGARPRTARDLAGILGRLHSLGTAGLAGTPRPDTADRTDLLAAMAARAAIVDDVAAALPGSPGLPLYRGLLAWLRAHVPAAGGPAVLVHGDVGFHNVLVVDGRVTALLDWEMAHRGRAAEDLAYVRPSVSKLLDWPEFLARYAEAGGHPADDDELRFFAVWQDVWRATSCLRLRTKFVLDPSRLSDGVSGLLLGARFLDNAVTTAFGER